MFVYLNLCKRLKALCFRRRLSHSSVAVTKAMKVMPVISWWTTAVTSLVIMEGTVHQIQSPSHALVQLVRHSSCVDPEDSFRGVLKSQCIFN